MTEQQYTTPQPTSSGYGAGSQPIGQPAQPQQPGQYAQPTQVADVQPVQPPAQPPKKKKGKGKVVLAVVLVLVLVFAGYVTIDSYLENAEYEASRNIVTGLDGDPTLCDPVINIPHNARLTGEHTGSYTVGTYLISIGITPHIIGGNSFFRKDPEHLEGKEVAIKTIDSNTKLVAEYRANDNGAGIHMNKEATKVALYDLMESVANCEQIHEMKFNTLDDANKALSENGVRSLQKLANFKKTLIEQIQVISLSADAETDFTTVDGVKKYAANFGLTDFILDRTKCNESGGGKEFAACINVEDGKIYFGVDTDKSQWMNTIKHEISHNLINVICSTTSPNWDDLESSVSEKGDFTTESVTNNFAIKILEADERTIYPSSDDPTLLDPLSSKFSFYVGEYMRHPKDDEAVARILKGECN